MRQPVFADKIVYDAEHAFQHALDRQYENPVIMIAGSTITVPREKKFGDLEAAQRYCNLITERFKLSRVKCIKGRVDARFATMGGGIMGLPPRAFRESIVLHEMAHHYAGGEHGHGSIFIDRFIELTEYAMGPEAGFILKINFYEMGIK